MKSVSPILPILECGVGRLPPEKVTHLHFFYIILVTLVCRQIPENFVAKLFVIARDMAYIKIGGGGQPLEGITYLNFVLPKTDYPS